MVWVCQRGKPACDLHPLSPSAQAPEEAEGDPLSFLQEETEAQGGQSLVQGHTRG